MHVCMVGALAVQSYHLSDSAVVGAHKRKKNAFHFSAHLSFGPLPPHLLSYAAIIQDADTLSMRTAHLLERINLLLFFTEGSF